MPVMLLSLVIIGATLLALTAGILPALRAARMPAAPGNRRRMRRVTTWCAIAVFLAGACASTGHDDNHRASSSAADEATQTVVALGGSATEGEGVADRFHNAWPYRLFGTALPRSTVFVNAAVEGATAGTADATQVPIVRELHPDIVVMWLGAYDAAVHTPIATFARALARVITAVQAVGVDRVLVGNLPAAFGHDVDSYNSAIDHVARETGAELVELDREHITATGAPGSEPRLDDASHRVVADAFGRKLASG